MVVQLAEGAAATAAAVLLYSFTCLCCSSVMVWLMWVHDERKSYVALLSYLTLLSTSASIGQQIHTIVWWRDVKIQQFEHAVAHPFSNESVVAGPSVGLDLALFYVQYYCYNAEALVTLFWAAALVRSIFDFRGTYASRRCQPDRTQPVAKCVAIVLPAALVCLLRLRVLRASRWGFVLVANIGILLSLFLGSLTLLVILANYVHIRRQLLFWRDGGRLPDRRSTTAYRVSAGATPGPGRDGPQSTPQPQAQPQQQSIYDRWLIVRFSIGFTGMVAFQLSTILFQLPALESGTGPPHGNTADLSAERARADLVSFVPGVSASLLVFLVFGTTKPFRDAIRRACLPARLRRAPAVIVGGGGGGGGGDGGDGGDGDDDDDDAARGPEPPRKDASSPSCTAVSCPTPMPGRTDSRGSNCEPSPITPKDEEQGLGMQQLGTVAAAAPKRKDESHWPLPDQAPAPAFVSPSVSVLTVESKDAGEAEHGPDRPRDSAVSL